MDKQITQPIRFFTVRHWIAACSAILMIILAAPYYADYVVYIESQSILENTEQTLKTELDMLNGVLETLQTSVQVDRDVESVTGCLEGLGDVLINKVQAFTMDGSTLIITDDMTNIFGYVFTITTKDPTGFVDAVLNEGLLLHSVDINLQANSVVLRVFLNATTNDIEGLDEEVEVTSDDSLEDLADEVGGVYG